MAFLRIKSIRKSGKNGKASIYDYVYEVESFKKRGKVKQKTIGLVGKYLRMEKVCNENFPIEKALQCDSKEKLLREIFTLNLANYGFLQEKPGIFKKNSIVANLNTCKVFDCNSKKPVYIDMHGKFFGTKTLKNIFKSENMTLFEFVKAVVASGAVCIESLDIKNLKESADPNLKLLQAILDKFEPSDKIEHMDFDKFTEEFGY